jgi:hypothetical protein
MDWIRGWKFYRDDGEVLLFIQQRQMKLYKIKLL